MKDKHLISIIIPVYNVDQYLSRCINSVINQTYKDLELILVDDGSTDNSGKICDEYVLKDNRIKVIHKQNGGVSSARNAGLDIAKGEYIGFVDSDDYIEKDMYEHLINLINIHKTLMAECNVFTVKNSNKKARILKKHNNKVIKYDSENALIHCFTDLEINNFLYNKLFHKSIFNGIRCPDGIYEDMAIMYKLIDRAKFVTRSLEAKYFYCIRKGSLTNSSFNNDRIIYFFSIYDTILNFCKTKNWNKAYNKIKNESIYMKARTLKKFINNKFLNKDYINNLRKDVLKNIVPFIKSSKSFYKKLSILFLCLFFYQCYFIKWKILNRNF